MIILDVLPGSKEWHRARHGVVTASAIHNLLNGGGAPKMPTYYGRSPMPGVQAPTKRAPKQLAIWEWLGDGPQPIEPSSALSALKARKAIVELKPPPDAEPVVPPITLSDKRDGYMARLLHEWATGSDGWEPIGSKRWIEHGHMCEGEALDYIRMRLDCEMKPVGLVYRDDTRTVACTPDGVHNAPRPDFGLELKCPAGWTHVKYLRAGVLPPEYVPQVQFSLWVTGLPMWYFMSYAASPEDPDMAWKPGAVLPPLLVEVRPEPRWQDAFDEHVPTFVAEMLAAREELIEVGVRAAE